VSGATGIVLDAQELLALHPGNGPGSEGARPVGRSSRVVAQTGQPAPPAQPCAARIAGRANAAAPPA
jgi:hypothetical protein